MRREESPHWIESEYPTAIGPLPRISTRLKPRDIIGGWKVRWGWRRMHFAIPPGLYAVGSPTWDSPVLVSANYKLTFDRLRQHLDNIDAWLLIVDTAGINVWCAAGKKHFTTGNVVRQVKASGLERLVGKHRLILPQLAAPGVAAHEVIRQTGFQVAYGPVRAVDIPTFLANGLKAEPAMRRVTFGLMERLALIPVELVGAGKFAVGIFAILSLLSLLSGGKIIGPVLPAFLPYLGALLVGTVAVPALLPWIPGRSLTFKGWLLGAAATFAWSRVAGLRLHGSLVYLLLLPAISAFLALNFTGSTTYTSLSGVRKEMRLGLPLLIISAAAGIIAAFIK